MADFKASTYLSNARKKKDEYNKDYTESSKVKGLYNSWQTIGNNKPGEWDGGQYGNMRNDLADQIANRQKFSYDLNGDMLYQQYKDNYINQGKQAMIDTMGQAAALTGGYGNSYAQSVGQQTYQGYLQELNNRVPELYQLALETYNQEGQDLANRFGVASDMYNTEYGQYRDKVSDWNTDYDRAYNIYNNERGNEQTQFNANRQYYSDAYNNLYNQEYSAFADDRSYALQQAQLAEQIRSNKAQEAISWYNAQKSGSGGGGGGKGKKLVTIDDIKKNAAKYKNNDDLYMYLGDQVIAGYITEEEAEELYGKYASTKNTAKSKNAYATGKNGAYSYYTQGLYPGK